MKQCDRWRKPGSRLYTSNGCFRPSFTRRSRPSPRLPGFSSHHDDPALLERETLEGWEVNQILIEETGIDYIKQKEHQEEPIGERMTIAPGAGAAPDVPTPVGQPASTPPKTT